MGLQGRAPSKAAQGGSFLCLPVVPGDTRAGIPSAAVSLHMPLLAASVPQSHRTRVHSNDSLHHIYKDIVSK